MSTMKNSKQKNLFPSLSKIALFIIYYKLYIYTYVYILLYIYISIYLDYLFKINIITCFVSQYFLNAKICLKIMADLFSLDNRSSSKEVNSEFLNDLYLGFA
jgi:hypothetical protein